MKRSIRVNDRGMRIGEGHHMAKLTDAEVDQLIRDRGPADAPTMSLARLARKWGLSKSGVKGIIDGRRRGQIGPSVDRSPPIRPKTPKVRVNLRISLHARAKLHRLGAGLWLERVLEDA